MKKTLSTLGILCLFQTSISQNTTQIKKESDSIMSPKLQDSIVKNIANTVKNDIKTEKLDNINFNPYRNKTKQYPFKIEFKDSTYASPIKGKKVITSRYGWRRGRPHKGIDLDLIVGDSVMAMFGGVVRFARYSSGHGRTVVVRHYNGLETAYAHLSKYLVKANDTVKKGQILGKGGVSGNARGSHLHLVISFKGHYINPEYLFNFSKTNKIRSKNIWVTKKWATAHHHTSKKQSVLELLTSQDEAITAQKKENKKQVYVVKRGDTLSGISNKYRVSLSRLCKTNALRKTSILKIGQKIIVSQ